MRRTEWDHGKSQKSIVPQEAANRSLRQITSTHNLSGHGVGKEGAMDFAIILILSNTFLAVLIYVVVTRIWQD